MKVGEAFDLKKGKKPNDLFPVKSGNRIRFIQIDDLRNNQNLKFCEQDKNNVLCSENDVVIAWDGANAGTVGWGLSGAIGSTLAVLSPKNKKDYYPPFVGRFISSKQNLLREKRIGATIPHLQRDSLVGLDLPEKSYAEQVEINQKLEFIDNLLEKRRQSLAKLDQLAQSIFLDMFGDPVTNPKNWPFKKFEEVCETRLGKMLDEKKQKHLIKKPYLRNANVLWGKLNLDSVYEMGFEKSELDEFKLVEGDLLICEGGDIGRTAIWKNQLKECYFQKALHRARVHKKIANPEFVMHLMYMLSVGGYFKQFSAQATIAHLTGVKLKAMPIPLPPLELQNKFNLRMNKLEVVKEKLQLSLASLENLQQSLSQKFFGV